MAELKTKSFFERPEGKTGTIFMVAGGVGAAFGLYYILPYLIILMQNMLYAGLLFGALAAGVFIISDKRVRTLAWYLYKSVMRAITGWVIEIDPIGILRGYIEDLKSKREDMEKSLANLNGQKLKLAAKIQQNEENRQRSLQMAKVANSQGQEAKKAFSLQSRKAGRLNTSNLTLQAVYNKMEAMNKILLKMYEGVDFQIQDLESEVEVKATERAALMASYNAFTAAKNVIDGEGDKREMFDQAMEHLADDYAMKVGEIEQFMDMSKGFLQSVDLENGVYEQDAMDHFEAWEKKADSLFTDAPKALPEAQPRVRIGREVLDSPVEEEARLSSFNDLFNNKKN